MNRFFKLLIILVLILSACVKKTAPPPVIEIFSPSHLSTWQVEDSIYVQAQIESSIALTYIEIHLLNTNQISVNPVLTIYPEGNSKSLNLNYAISNTSIESGQHYFMIEASNGEAEEKAYVNIMISSIPKQSLCLIAYGYESGSLTHIYKVDSLLTQTQFKELNGDFDGGAINSENQVIYSIGKYSGSFYSINAQSGAIINEIPAIINPPFPYFNTLSYQNNLLLIGLYEGYINGYFGNGNLKFSYIVDLFRPKKLKYDGKYILGSFEYQSGGAAAFGVIWEISGLVKDMVFTSFETVEFFRVEGDLVLIFANNGINSEVYTLNTQNMVVTKIKTLPAGDIYSAVQCSTDDFIISHVNGLLIYNYGNNTYADFYSGAKKGELCFDEVDERLYLSSGKEIYSYTWPGAIESGPLVMPDSIRDIHILYNR